jgi:hypothetical protein
VIEFFISQIGYASFTPIDPKRLHFPQKKFYFFYFDTEKGIGMKTPSPSNLSKY